MPTQQPFSAISKDKEIAKALFAMATRRQATLSDDAIRLYVEDLMSYPLSDVQDACRAIGSAIRSAGEKALPEVGVILEEVRRLGKLRNNPDQRCRHCSDGLVFVVNLFGQSTAVRPCPSCGGPKWYQRSLEHNSFLPVPRKA